MDAAERGHESFEFLRVVCMGDTDATVHVPTGPLMFSVSSEGSQLMTLSRGQRVQEDGESCARYN